MASGLCTDANGVGLTLMNYLSCYSSTALSLTQPYKCCWMSAVRTNNDNVGGTTDAEWVTAGGYTQSGSGSTGGVAFPVNACTTATADGGTTHLAHAVNAGAGGAITTTNVQTNTTWAGNLIKDTTATNKNIWFGTLSGGSKTINAGDTCTLPASTGISFTLG